jgi:hypothetical protein
MSEIEHRHERHVCAHHPEPGICVHDRDSWPCDARRLLDAIGGEDAPGVRYHFYFAAGGPGEERDRTSDKPAGWRR